MKIASVLTIFLLIITAIVILAQFSGTDSDYSRYNTNWNGTSDFFTAAPQQYIYDYRDLTSLKNTTLLIIAPNEHIAEVAQSLTDYLIRGNTVIIADKNGNSNALLNALGSSIRIMNGHIRSSDKAYDDTRLFRGYISNTSPIFGSKNSSILVNYPGYVTGGIPIINTSQLAWKDVTYKNDAGENDKLMIYVLGAYNTIGIGKLIVIADPSLFINSMQSIQYSENRKALDTLINDEHLYIDQSFSKTVDRSGGLFGWLPLITRYPVIAAITLSTLCLIGAGVLFSRERKQEENDRK